MTIQTWHSDDVVVKIDYDKCTGHADCVDVCPSEVYELVDDKAVAANVDDCVQCCACVEACPQGAIDHSACS